MVLLLKKISMAYLMLSIIVCSTPRCDYIIKSLQAIDFNTVGMSCHEENQQIDPDLSQFSSHRNCECELLSFVVTEPPIPVRSIEKVDLQLFEIEDSIFSASLTKVQLDIQTPPPRLV